MIEPRYLTLAEARDSIRSMDQLFFLGDGEIAAAIQFAGRGRVSHAAKALWCNEELWAVEAREFAGVRAVSLAGQIDAYPGRIEVWRTNAINLPEGTSFDVSHLNPPLAVGEYYDRAAATRLARKLTGQRYGYLAILKSLATHLPLVWAARCASRWLPWLRPLVDHLAARWGLRKMTDDQLAAGERIFCATFCSVVDRVGGGVDPVPDLADPFTEPADLARSLFYRGANDRGYVCTLVPDDWQGANHEGTEGTKR